MSELDKAITIEIKEIDGLKVYHITFNYTIVQSFSQEVEEMQPYLKAGLLKLNKEDVKRKMQQLVLDDMMDKYKGVSMMTKLGPFTLIPMPYGIIDKEVFCSFEFQEQVLEKLPNLFANYCVGVGNIKPYEGSIKEREE